MMTALFCTQVACIAVEQPPATITTTINANVPAEAGATPGQDASTCACKDDPPQTGDAVVIVTPTEGKTEVDPGSGEEEVPTVPKSETLQRPQIERNLNPHINSDHRAQIRRRQQMPPQYYNRGPPPQHQQQQQYMMNRGRNQQNMQDPRQQNQGHPRMVYMQVPYQIAQQLQQQMYHPGRMYGNGGGPPMRRGGGNGNMMHQRNSRPPMREQEHNGGGYYNVPNRFMEQDMLQNIPDEEVGMVYNMARDKIDNRRNWHQMRNGEVRRFEQNNGMCPEGQEPNAQGWERGESEDIVDAQGNKIGHEEVKQVVMKFDSSKDCVPKTPETVINGPEGETIVAEPVVVVAGAVTPVAAPVLPA